MPEEIEAGSDTSTLPLSWPPRPRKACTGQGHPRAQGSPCVCQFARSVAEVHQARNREGRANVIVPRSFYKAPHHPRPACGFLHQAKAPSGSPIPMPQRRIGPRPAARCDAGHGHPATASPAPALPLHLGPKYPGGRARHATGGLAPLTPAARGTRDAGKMSRAVPACGGGIPSDFGPHAFGPQDHSRSRVTPGIWFIAGSGTPLPTPSSTFKGRRASALNPPRVGA